MVDNKVDDVKKWLQTKPLWLKGGILFGILMTILCNLGLVFHSPILGIFIALSMPVYIIEIFLFIFLLGIFTSKESSIIYATGICISILLLFIYWFIIGVLITKLYVKFKAFRVKRSKIVDENDGESLTQEKERE